MKLRSRSGGLGAAALAVALAVLVTGCARPEAPAPAPVAAMTLAEAVANPERPAPERDAHRHPLETLGFFGLEGDDVVVEVLPGNGWYSAILAPFLASGGGRLVAAHFDPATATPAQAEILSRYAGRFPDVTVVAFDAPETPWVEAGTADLVVTFRNFHSLLAARTAERFLAQAFAALKPSGVLGVVQHRLPSVEAQDPEARSGYVHEELVIQLATEAGFVLEGRSDINANPDDDANHPFGVWTLPPVLRTSPLGESPDPSFDSAPYLAIGESDRMTLRFVKPLPGAEPPAQAAPEVEAPGTGEP
jgi:predicted methyltransferase